MRILFATGQGGGHFQPLVPFARAAVRAGHEVVVAAPGSARGMVERAGFAFHALGEPWDRAAKWAPVFNGGAPGAAHVVQELFIALDARAALPGMIALVHNDRPDLIVRETTEFSSCVAAAHFDVPVVDVGPHLDAAIDTDQGLRALAAPALELLGPFRLNAPVVTLSPFGDTDAVTRFRHPAGERVDESLVYVSFGSEIRSPDLFRATAHALADVPKRVLMTIGRHVDPDALGPLPANVHVEPWVDQADGHAARRRDGRPRRFRLHPRRAGRRRPDRVRAAVRRRPGQRRARRGARRRHRRNRPRAGRPRAAGGPRLPGRGGARGERDPRAAAGRRCGGVVQS